MPVLIFHLLDVYSLVMILFVCVSSRQLSTYTIGFSRSWLPERLPPISATAKAGFAEIAS
jgi:hypothetical protein